MIQNYRFHLPPSQTADKNIVIVDATDDCGTLTVQIFTFRINKDAFSRFIFVFMVFRLITMAIEKILQPVQWSQVLDIKYHLTQT